MNDSAVVTTTSDGLSIVSSADPLETATQIQHMQDVTAGTALLSRLPPNPTFADLDALMRSDLAAVMQ